MTTTRRIWTALLAVSVLLAVTACGGGESAEDEANRTVDSILAEIEGADSSLPDPFDTSEPRSGSTGGSVDNEFEEVPGVTMQFVNTYATGGSGEAIDVYWGRSISTGKKITTVPYGTISDPVPLEIESNPMLGRSDGEDELVVSFYREGATEGQPLGQNTEVLSDETTRFVSVIGATDQTGSDGAAGASTMLGKLDGIAEPPAGEAMVVLNDIGVQAIDDGDFLTLSPQGQCDAWELFSDLDDVDANTGNLGTAYAAPAGATAVVASDANTDCATGLPPVDVDIADGGLYVLYAYGTTVADRQVLVFDASE
jgi:hypothetical protein